MTKTSVLREFAELYGSLLGATCVQLVLLSISDGKIEITLMTGISGAIFGWLVGWSLAVVIMGKKPDTDQGKEGRIRNAQRRAAVGALSGTIIGYLVHLGVDVVVDHIVKRIGV